MGDVIETTGLEQQAGRSGSNSQARQQTAAAPKDSMGSMLTAPKLPSKQGNHFGLPPMTDEFIMFEWKVSPCPKTYGHDWSVCPCAHPNEKTKRRSPKLYPYKPDICPDMKQSNQCPRGDNCLMSHSIYEYHLHPARFHTELCRMGSRCTRALCFFAHSLQELRSPHPNINASSFTAGGSFGPAHATAAGLRPQQQSSGGMAVILHAPVLGMQQGPARDAGRSGSNGTTAFGSSARRSGPHDSAQLQQQVQLAGVQLQQQQQQQQPIMLGGHMPLGNSWQQGQQYVQVGQAGDVAGSAAPGQVAPHVVRSMLAQLASAPGNPNPGAALNAMAQLQAELAGLSVSAATAAMYAGPAGQRPVMLQAAEGLAMAPAFGSAPISHAMLVQSSLPQMQQQQVLYQQSFDGLQPGVLLANNNPAGGGFVAVQQQHIGPVVPAGYRGTLAAAGDLPPDIIYQQVPQGVAASSLQNLAVQPQPQQQQQQQQQVVLVPMHMGGNMWA